MKRTVFSTLVLLIFIQPAFAQDYERVEASILLYPTYFEKPEDLSRFISRDFNTEEEKVRAIYAWIIRNIAYDPKEYKRFDYSFKDYRERNSKDEEKREKIIQRTIKKGVAVCEGYAMLFERLCELQGIQNYLVRGDTKSNFGDIGRPFDTLHMWNVAYIDGEPYLFDPTWGAGKYRDKFIKDPTYVYYKTTPEQFAKSHCPEMEEDAFYPGMVSRTDFSMMPLILDKEINWSNIEMPEKGVIYSEQYFDEIQFSILNSNPETVSYAIDEKIIPISDFKVENGKLSFSVPLQIGMKKLMVYLDGKPTLGYLVK